jgi:hypothetical protein
MWNEGGRARCLDVAESRGKSGEMRGVSSPGPDGRERRRGGSAPGRGDAPDGARIDTSADSVPTGARSMRLVDDPWPPEAAVHRTPARADAG